MSLTVDGVWKAGVWASTVWASGVWFEPGITGGTSSGEHRLENARRTRVEQSFRSIDWTEPFIDAPEPIPGSVPLETETPVEQPKAPVEHDSVSAREQAESLALGEAVLSVEKEVARLQARLAAEKDQLARRQLQDALILLLMSEGGM